MVSTYAFSLLSFVSFLTFQFIPFPLFYSSPTFCFSIPFKFKFYCSKNLSHSLHYDVQSMVVFFFCCYYYLVGNLDYIQEKGYTSFKHERTIDPKQVYEQNKQVRPFLKRVNTCFPEEWIHWPLKILVSRQYCQPFILFSQSSLKCSVHLCSATVAAQFPTFLLKYSFIFV